MVKKKLPVYSKAEPAKILPTSMWWLSVHTSDVWCRREVLKACITSIFGNILKIDSTKKILKKLSCDAKDSASWVTNVGNEYSAVLQSIVTGLISNENLQPLADGIMKRYNVAAVPPPSMLYTDRDCCNHRGQK